MLGSPVTYRKYLDVVEEKEETDVKHKVDGTTQDFIKRIQTFNLSYGIRFCWTFHHVQELLKDYPKVKKVAVDTFMFSNELFIYDTCDLKANTNLLEKFDCR
ncbi:hypothetical protein MFLAVUS_010119 [Mucor flavus]|uniref:Uncharacterized protein n=1 Tax=Mucor flavus TaxID=439312 RepID=A0ABP9ZBU0_9FUNG